MCDIPLFVVDEMSKKREMPRCFVTPYRPKASNLSTLKAYVVSSFLVDVLTVYVKRQLLLDPFA